MYQNVTSVTTGWWDYRLFLVVVFLSCIFWNEHIFCNYEHHYLCNGNTAEQIMCFYLGSTKWETIHPNRHAWLRHSKTAVIPRFIIMIPHLPTFTQKCFFLGKVGLQLFWLMFPPQIHVVGNCFLSFTLGFLQCICTLRVMINAF